VLCREVFDVNANLFDPYMDRSVDTVENILHPNYRLFSDTVLQCFLAGAELVITHRYNEQGHADKAKDQVFASLQGISFCSPDRAFVSLRDRYMPIYNTSRFASTVP